MKLVIVESPAKCTTIKRYLGDQYNVLASYGHVRDLATRGKGGLGVDVEHNFAPTYVVTVNKQKVVNELIAASKKCDEVILATDPDREGEAIAWHLANVLNLDIAKTKRLEFHEITRDSIGQAMTNPRTIDTKTVASQETRRILDRIIGFKLSTLLNKKIKSKSAGRVQSATLKLINDHDLEIEKFVPQEYWNILSNIDINGNSFALTFVGENGKSIEIKNKEEADRILNKIPEEVKVLSVNKSFRFKESKEPFTTSTMQQEAFARLHFKTKKTQSLAQQLYEGIEVNGEHVGLITYMRTDSTRLSETFIARAKNYITEKFGPEYVGKPKQKVVNSENTQDGHEAIRPTSNHRTPESLLNIDLFLKNKDLYKLYKLIYNRAVASLMKAKKEEVLTIILGANDLTFKIELAHTVFPGYEALLADNEEEKEFKGKFPEINVGDYFKVIKKEGEQKFTQAPSHYSEAKLVKLMEEVGIGRPSTYVSTLDTLKKRRYVEDKGGIITVTEQGRKTVDYLQDNFSDIVNTKYTADMEEKLDKIQEGQTKSLDILTNFYGPFMEEVKKAGEITAPKQEDEILDELCPKCGSHLKVIHGRNGTFVGCSNYPKCKYVKKDNKPAVEVGRNCPKCGSPLVEREKKGSKFIACSNFPKCKYTETKRTQDINAEAPVVVKKCPKCGGDMVKKKGKYGYLLGCTNYPQCKYWETIYKRKRK